MKKFIPGKKIRHKTGVFKILMIMKFVSIFMLVAVLHVSAATGYSQTKRLSLNIENAGLKEIFRQIESQSEFSFFYKDENIDPDRRFSVKLNNVLVTEILDNLFRTEKLTYTISGKIIVILPQNAQQNSQPAENIVSGRVTDTEGLALPGVNVRIKGTATGTITDAEGKYSIAVPENANTLIFSFVGMRTKQVPVEGKNRLDVVLEYDIVGLDEVVAVGYGTMVKQNITGSVTVVDKEKIGSQAPLTISSALQGISPGVNVINSGNPGQEPIVQIRGLKSFHNATPLYVIDGVPTGDSRELNPNDIESIQVLKDASAAAIYGSRAANGVIIITTQKGKKGQFTVEFSGRYGISDITNRLEVMNAENFAALNNLAHQNAGLPTNPGSDWAFDPQTDTDWQDAFFKTGYNQDYNLSVSGGSENSTFMFSGGYFKNQGTAIGPNFERATISLNSEHKYKKFKFGEHFKLSRSDENQLVDVPFVDIVRMLPTIPVYNPENPGGFGYGSDYNPTYGSNPIGLQELNDHNLRTNKVLGNVYGEYQIFDFLTYKLNFGLDFYNNNQKNLHKEGKVRYSNPLMPSSLSENRHEYYKTVLEHTLTFEKNIKKHYFNAVVGYTQEKSHFDNTFAMGEELAYNPSTGDYFEVLGATQSQQEVNGLIEKIVLLSQFGRINYSFNEKYLFTATLRRDGSSKFAKGNRWGVFPSFSAGWKIHQENFMQSIPQVSTLKIRGGYGELGGQEAGPYDYMGTINTNVNYVLGMSQAVLNGHTQIQLANKDLTWQTTASTNIALDLGLLKDKIFFTTEYYIADTRNALIPVDIPLSTGNFEGNPNANVGEFRNSGLEFALSYKKATGEFKYSATATFSSLKNEVISLKNNPNGIVSWLTKTEVGHSIGTFYLLETNGIFQSDDQVQAHTSTVVQPDGSTEEVVIQPGAQAGDVRYIDFNQDGIINDDDRQLMGNPFPKYEFGLHFSASYKNFDLNLLVYGVGGHKIFNVPRFWLERTDDDSNYPADFQPWTSENPSNSTPRAVFGAEGAQNNIQHTDRWLEDGDFVKLKNLELGYSLPKKWLKPAKIAKCRIYFSAQNLLTFTNYTGLDPEVVNLNILNRGIDDGSFPNVRTIAFGIQLGF